MPPPPTTTRQTEYHANFEGSSGSMDATRILNIIQRSIENYGMWYLEFLGDGDSKANKLLLQEAVYANVDVKNLNAEAMCRSIWAHAFTHWKSEWGKTPLEDRKPIGGTGRLTENKIDKLQVYFGKAIK